MTNPPDTTGLAWDTYRCECGGEAPMGIMSVVAHCQSCPRVYVTGVYARGWFSNIDAANAAENAGRRIKEAK